jgi:hypothetical protein
MPTGPLHNPTIKTHCGYAIEQPGNQQYALRVRLEDGKRGVVYVVLCQQCQEKYRDTMLRVSEIQDWLERGIIPVKDTK